MERGSGPPAHPVSVTMPSDAIFHWLRRKLSSDLSDTGIIVPKRPSVYDQHCCNHRRRACAPAHEQRQGRGGAHRDGDYASPGCAVSSNGHRSDARMSPKVRFAIDSPLKGSGFEPSVPLPRLSSIRAVRAEIIGRSTDVFRRDREFDVSPGKTQHLLPKSVFDRPGSDRWNLASTTFPDAGPMVRIRLPPALSPLRTSFSGGKRGKVRGDDKGLEFCSALGVVLSTVKGHAAPEAGHAYARARDVWEQLGSPREFLGVPFGQSRYHMFRGELDRAQSLAEDLLRLSRQRNDAAGLILGHLSSGRNLRFAGRFASSRSHLEEVLAHYDPILYRSLVHQAGNHPHVNSQSLLGIVLLCLGFPDQALARSNAAIAEARRQD